MSQTQAETSVQLLILRGVVASLPKEDQDKVHDYSARVRALVDEGGGVAKIALSLVVAEELDK